MRLDDEMNEIRADQEYTGGIYKRILVLTFPSKKTVHAMVIHETLPWVIKKLNGLDASRVGIHLAANANVMHCNVV